MSVRSLTRLSAVGLLSLGLVACVQPAARAPTAPAPATAAPPKTVAVRSPQQQKLGDENHEKIMAKYGGRYDNPRLQAYVDDIGRDLVSVSEQPGEKWTFTVLDTPKVNAFALPGGYVYVTRGLVALANSEAELAGVIGHEIGHVTAGHSALRQDRALIATGALIGVQLLGAVLGLDPNVTQAGTQLGQAVAGGFLADYSRSDELAADNLGIRYLARAGYDPFAQADFLESMGASAALDAKMAGQTYNPNATDFFASHPATGPRTRRAIEIARGSGEAIPDGAPRARGAFLSAIRGITYGDSARQGFVRGRVFAHPELRFTYTSPSGFTILNSSNAVTAKGPKNARFILDGDRNPQGDLRAYITRQWVPRIGKTYRVGRVSNLRNRQINGLQAASARVPVQVNGQVFDALLVAIRSDGRLYRLTGLAPRGSGMIGSIEQAAGTFRRLSAAEAARLQEERLDVVTVRAGDTVESLARRMSGDFALERFRVLNALKPGDTLQPGELVKIAR